MTWLWLAFAPVTAGAGPFPLSYGGRLTDPTGIPVAGPVDLAVNFFCDETGGNPLLGGPVVVPSVTLQDGVFQLTLTSSNGAGHYYGCTASGNAVLRGASSLNGAAAGVFGASLGRGPSHLDSYTGFRCAFSNVH